MTRALLLLETQFCKRKKEVLGTHVCLSPGQMWPGEPAVGGCWPELAAGIFGHWSGGVGVATAGHHFWYLWRHFLPRALHSSLFLPS